MSKRTSVTNVDFVSTRESFFSLLISTRTPSLRTSPSSHFYLLIIESTFVWKHIMETNHNLKKTKLIKRPSFHSFKIYFHFIRVTHIEAELDTFN